MSSHRATLYRGLLRELRRTVCHPHSIHKHPLTPRQITPPRKVNMGIIAHFRRIAEKIDDKNAAAKQDYENAILFIRSQHEHKVKPASVVCVPRPADDRPLPTAPA